MPSLTRTAARIEKETRWTRLTEFCVDTLWALKRFASSIAGWGEQLLEFKGLGERARLLVKDDVLVMRI